MKITIRAARVNAGLKQTDVASAMNVSRETVRNWEKGVTKPTIDKVEHLCNLLGVTYDDIIWNF